MALRLRRDAKAHETCIHGLALERLLRAARAAGRGSVLDRDCRPRLVLRTDYGPQSLVLGQLSGHCLQAALKRRLEPMT